MALNLLNLSIFSIEMFDIKVARYVPLVLVALIIATAIGAFAFWDWELDEPA